MQKAASNGFSATTIALLTSIALLEGAMQWPEHVAYTSSTLGTGAEEAQEPDEEEDER